MSNTKDIFIGAEVPFNWLMFDSPLTDEDKSFLAAMFLGAYGLDLTYGQEWYVPNDHGGRTCMQEIRITGVEALSYPAIDRLIDILGRAGTVNEATAQDLDDPSPRFSLI